LFREIFLVYIVFKKHTKTQTFGKVTQKMWICFVANEYLCPSNYYKAKENPSNTNSI